MKLEEDYPDKARGIAKFDAALAHKLFAGADLMIITSRFEPCGLIQLQAMQYGTPSMCASTGGLVNTIVDGVTGFHMGAFHVDVMSAVNSFKVNLSLVFHYQDPAFESNICLLFRSSTV